MDLIWTDSSGRHNLAIGCDQPDLGGIESYEEWDQMEISIVDMGNCWLCYNVLFYQCGYNTTFYTFATYLDASFGRLVCLGIYKRCSWMNA